MFEFVLPHPTPTTHQHVQFWELGEKSGGQRCKLHKCNWWSGPWKTQDPITFWGHWDVQRVWAGTEVGWTGLDFPGGADGKASVHNVRDLGSIPGLGRFPGEGNGNPLQYSCLENPMDGGAWCRLLSMGSQRVRHDWATSLSFFLCIYDQIEVSLFIWRFRYSRYFRYSPPHPAIITLIHLFAHLPCIWHSAREQEHNDG